MASGSSKEVKQLLKSAREAIRGKEYKEALKHCKTILKQDKTNYNALVFVGVAAAELDQPDQAVAAYRKAIETDQQQLLAWQGLAGFYEKSTNPDHRAELSGVYSQLRELLRGKDDKKWLEVSKKLAELHRQLGNIDEAVQVLKSIIGAEECKDSSTCLRYWIQITDTLTEVKEQSKEYTSLLESAYKVILESGEEQQRHLVNYIKFLKKCSDISKDRIQSECLKMRELFPSDPFPLRLLVEIFLQQDPECLDDVAFSVYNKLRELDETSCLASLGLGQVSLAKRDYLLARKSLQEGLQGCRNNVHGWLYLARSQLHLHDNQASIESAKEALKVASASKLAVPQLKRALLRVQGDALLDTGTLSHVQKALQIYEKLLGQTEESHQHDIVCGICASHLILEDMEKAEEFYQRAHINRTNDDKVIALQGQICTSQNHLDKAEQRFVEALAISPYCGLYHFWLGKVYWEMGRETRTDKSKMLASLLTAAKLDPYYSDTFLYLGHYYWKVACDKSKGRKCYQKAYELNSHNDDAAAALGDACIELGEEEAALQLYRNVTSAASPGTVKWAWLRLGLHYQKQASYNDAVASFQAALRADPKDRHCWECLGDAYMSRGSYTASLKAFTRGVELDPNATYCCYQIAAIKQTLESYSEAVNDYQVILDADSEYIPALKGQGETYIRLARSSLKQYFNGRAIDYVKLAIKVLARAASLRPDLSCVWKLLGDTCSMLHPLSDKLISVPVPSSLLDHSLQRGTSRQNKGQLLAIGARCYGRALHLQSNCATLWHDLGMNYYYQSLNDHNNSAQLADKAVQCLKKALGIDSTGHAHWTTLGVVAAGKDVDNPGLAQHAFIKSIQLEPNNVVAWTNLGTLYLTKGNVELAHQAFKISQSLEPSYVHCWIGQALVAETIVTEEAMDLFRHTTELATHSEGAISYAHWVCQTLLDPSLDSTSERYRYNIVQMDAVSMATVGLDKVTDRIQTNACAFTMYGLLLERQGLHKSAEKAFARALELVQAEHDKEKLNIARANHARSLCSVGNYEEAVKQFQAVIPLVRLEDICCLALALYKTGSMQASYQAYEQALQLSSDGGIRSQMMACLGMVAFQCGDNDRAKTLLFQSSQEPEPAPDGLLSLLALGVHLSDFTLATAAVAELQKLKDKPGFVADVAFAGAVLYGLQGQNQLACRQVTKATGRHPGLPELWRLMAEIILQLLPEKARAAVTCSSASIQDKEVSQDSVSTYALATLAVGQHSQSTPANQRCLSAAQKAVHLYPDSLENWAALSASYLSHGIWNMTQRKESRNADNSIASKLATSVQSWAKERGNAAIYQWASVQIVVSLMHEGRLQRADALTRKLEAIYQSQDDFKSTLQLLQAQAVCMQHVSHQSVEFLRTVISRSTHQSSAAWQLLAELYEQEGMAAAAESAYRQSLVHSKGQQLVPLLRLAHLALKAAKVSNEERWVSLVHEATTEALKLQPTCTIALLLQGIQQQNKGNARPAKRCFQQVLEMSAGDQMNRARSVARYYMMKYYIGKKDNNAAQVLIEEATEEQDPNLQLFKELVPSA